MKAPPFTHHRPTSLAQALGLLLEHGDEAKVLAGGQSLLPLMNLRLGRPTHLVDLELVPGLDEVSVGDDGSVTVGAMVRHEQARTSPVIDEHAPLIAAAMPWVAHRAIRTRGTVVGSVAHADPAAEMPAVVLATDAVLVAESAERGRRELGAADFFEGYLQTGLAEDEILTGIRLPAWSPDQVGSVVEVARRHGDYALVGVVTRLRLDGETVAEAALAYFGAGSTAVRAPSAEAALIGQSASETTIADAAGRAADELDPPHDNHGSAAYRRHLVDVLTRQGLTDALATQGAPA